MSSKNIIIENNTSELIILGNQFQVLNRWVKIRLRVEHYSLSKKKKMAQQ